MKPSTLRSIRVILIRLVDVIGDKGKLLLFYFGFVLFFSSEVYDEVDSLKQMIDKQETFTERKLVTYWTNDTRSVTQLPICMLKQFRSLVGTS